MSRLAVEKSEVPQIHVQELPIPEASQGSRKGQSVPVNVSLRKATNASTRSAHHGGQRRGLPTVPTYDRPRV